MCTQKEYWAVYVSVNVAVVALLQWNVVVNVDYVALSCLGKLQLGNINFSQNIFSLLILKESKCLI